MKTSRAAKNIDAATTVGAVGCACLLQIAFVAALVAAAILAARWALTTHAFGL